MINAEQARQTTTGSFAELETRVSEQIRLAASRGEECTIFQNVPDGQMRDRLEKLLIESGYSVTVSSDPQFDKDGIYKYTYDFDISWKEQDI